MKKVAARDRLSPSFRASEFRCRCRRAECDALPMDRGLIEKLQAIRDDWGRCLIPTSGARCRYWNEKVGGADDSQHLYSRAVDFYFEDPNLTIAFIALAEKHGFAGIGHGKHLVHLDVRPLGKGDPPARWTYRD